MKNVIVAKNVLHAVEKRGTLFGRGGNRVRNIAPRNMPRNIQAKAKPRR
jgi:hypothetical protein